MAYSILRLKHHLSRRHMLSSRCQRCWISFDDKNKLTQHIQQESCHLRPQPETDRLMTRDNMIRVEETRRSTSEDTWWDLFQALIPGMNTRSVSSLKTQYSPYYVPRSMTLAMPSFHVSSITFPLSLEELQIANHILDSTDGNTLDRTHLETLTVPMDSMPRSSFLWSQPLSVPLYESSSPLHEVEMPSSFDRFPGTASYHSFAEEWLLPELDQGYSTTSRPTSGSGGSYNLFTSQAEYHPGISPATLPSALDKSTVSIDTTQKPTMASALEPDQQTQARRNSERLQARIQWAENTTKSLREQIRDAQADLSDVASRLTGQHIRPRRAAIRDIQHTFANFRRSCVC
ncbi:hypothetical protein B0H63DRAFT_75332 [Podospora didyma]|uniref:C2H2-type domain-containing protein n=1 Tax=Podospora didyma TaxID=330526 RepID=A0AAE0N333_9PEZI|nr:hypothetical protein B0H63DRAFT_75332 [Podospora didyma]